MAIRNSYIVTKALNRYLRGSVIVAISGHLITTTDAVVVSWLISQKAFTAVNTVIPILTLFSFLMIMLSTGASISISKSLGRRDTEKVNLSFSASVVGAIIIGFIIAGITFIFTSDIVKVLVHGDKSLSFFAYQYLQNYCYAIPFLTIAGVVGNSVRTDGNSNLVSSAVWTGLIINIILDIIFIRYLDLGIKGASWATAINYFIVLIICLFHFLSRNNTIRWSNNIKKYLSQIILNCKLGFSTSLANLMLAITLFVINIIMLHFQGQEGIYCWAVCYQIFLILQMIILGIDSSIFALGGTLLGEDDVKGLDFLYRKSAIYLLIFVIVLSSAIILFPEFFGKIFGNRGEDKLDLLPIVLKIFSIFLLPYALCMQVRSIYTILERSRLSLGICLWIFVLMILFVYGFNLFRINPIWWSFPISAWLLLIFVFFYSLIIHLKNRNLRIFSLIPNFISDPSFNVSVGINDKELNKTEEEIQEFLTKQNLNEEKITLIVSVTQSIMENILKNFLETTKKKGYFDLNVRKKGSEIIVIIKDDGRRLDQREESELLTDLNCQQDEKTYKNLNSECRDFTSNYFYMNDQNTFTLNFALNNIKEAVSK